MWTEEDRRQAWEEKRQQDVRRAMSIGSTTDLALYDYGFYSWRSEDQKQNRSDSFGFSNDNDAKKFW